MLPKKEIKLQNDNDLECPACGGGNLHQCKVTTFWRNEDAELGRKVISSTADTIETKDMQSNPSPRRSGILIMFECETCYAEPEMSIIQHKGSTYIGWHSMRVMHSPL